MTRYTFIKRMVLIGCFALLALITTSQDEALELIDGVSQKLESVNDYSADVNIVSDLPLIRILPVKATVYFKQPGKFHIETKGIAILPRQGYHDIRQIIVDPGSFVAVRSGTEAINDVSCEIINVIPTSDTGDVALAKLWIDPVENLVHKSIITSRTSGTLVIEYAYGQHRDYGLPDNLTFTIDVAKFKLPKGIATDFNRAKKDSKNEDKEPKTGKIDITLTNYQINTGLSDSIFE
jgi:outer membrane lipoprotein-sorting protein